MTTIRLGLILLATAAAAGCATDFPRVDAALGKSQAAMIAAQTYDPQAAAHPPALAPAVGDGQRLQNVLDAHRKDVPEPTNKQPSKPQEFNSENQGG